MRVPKELGLQPGTVGRLDRCCYGARDAGMLWEEADAEILTQACFSRRKSSPCVFYHKARQLMVVRHGDDFTALGAKKGLDWYEGILSAAFEIGNYVRMGEAPEDAKQVRILNRILTLDESGLRYEADPRHAERLARPLNVEACR